jgi:eukaryotic-like serine/threonine-protein kinase
LDHVEFRVAVRMKHGGYGGDPGTAPGGDPFGSDPFTVGPTSPSGAPAPTSQQQETNTLATLSVVFAFVFAPAGVVLGHVALSQIHETKDRGRDRALVGVTLSYVFITVVVVALVVSAAGVHAR